MTSNRAPLESVERFFEGLAAVSRTIRARGRLSQKQVAHRAGVSTRFISDVENTRANPTVTQLDRLATGLGLAGLDELVTLADEGAAGAAKITSRSTT